MSASRPAPRCCSTAAPTSSPRRATPAATTSSPTSCPDRIRSAATRRSALAGCSTESTTAASREPATRPITASTPTSPPAATDGWTTRYVGIPADNPRSTAPFASTAPRSRRAARHLRLRRAGHLLALLRRTARPASRYACPTAASSRAWPARSRVPAPQPPGYVGKPLSADGTHFVFGSMQRIRAGWQRSERRRLDLLPRPRSGEPPSRLQDERAALLGGDGIGELDISADGDRVVIGQLVAKTAGTSYWHLYMHIAGGSQIDRPDPGTARGRPYDGMSEDGTVAYFTSRDTPTAGGDGRTAPTSSGPTSGPRAPRVTGCPPASRGTGETDAAIPPPTRCARTGTLSARKPNCDVLAVGGGGGVAPGSGSIYFLSPEQLDGPSETSRSGMRPTLHRRRRARLPHFIRTLESSANAPLPEAAHPFKRSFGQRAYPMRGARSTHRTATSTVRHRQQPREPRFVYKYDSEGNQYRPCGTAERFQRPDVFGDFELPSASRSTTYPASPNYRESLRAGDRKKFKVNVFSPGGRARIRHGTPGSVRGSPSTPDREPSTWRQFIGFVFNIRP